MKRVIRSCIVLLLGTYLESALVGQGIAPRTFRAVAGESITAASRDGVPPMATITSARTTPSLEFPIRVLTTSASEASGLKLVIPPATPPGGYTIEIAGRGPSGLHISTMLQVTVDAVTLAPATVARPPVILLNGFQLICNDTASTLAASVDTFGQLASLLQSDGVGVAYFNNCTYGDISIEQLAGQLSNYIAGIHYTDGTPINRVDLVVHSMGGLISRAYLAGKGQTSGVFSPPTNPKVRKLVTIASPHFGSFQALYVGTQLSELVPGNQFLWDLATWNQGQDDLRGVDALAIIGNAGTYGTANSGSDGVVSLSSGSLGFAVPNQRTRIVPYCHVTPGFLTGLAMSCFNYQGIADINDASHLSAQIIRSFLADTTAWQSVGNPPSADPFLSRYGGAILALKGSNDVYFPDLTAVTFDSAAMSLTAGPNNAIASLYYSEFIPGGPHSFSLTHSNGQVTTGTGTPVAGWARPLLFKFPPTVNSVGPLLPGSGLVVQAGTTITISGVGFGAQQCATCRVTASNPQSTVLQVSSWSDTAIMAFLPASFGVGIAQIGVTTASGFDAINIMAATVAAPPAITPVSTHVGNFLQGQSNGAYTLLIQNNGLAATNGSVLVTDTLPAGLTAIAISGPGWACALATLACSRSDALAPGGNYPPITVTVNVATNAATPVTNQVTASGGDSATESATDPTTILAAFTDVSSSDSFLPAIDLLMEYSITSGCGASPPLYCSTENVTEGQMAVFVVRSVMGGDNFTYTQTPYFSDVPSSYIFFPWIQKMQDLGIALPCASNQFCPEAPVTRGIMAVLIIRGRYGVATPSNYPATPYFTDAGTNNPYFPWIQKMEQLGITSGCGPTTYCPDDPVTRGQMAVFIMRGEFNQFLPATAPVVVWASPATISPGQAAVVTILGQSTNFSSGTTQLNAGAGITVSNISVTNGTTMTAQFTVGPGATVGPRSITVTTGSEEATLPNGLLIR